VEWYTEICPGLGLWPVGSVPLVCASAVTRTHGCLGGQSPRRGSVFGGFFGVLAKWATAFIGSMLKIRVLSFSTPTLY